MGKGKSQARGSSKEDARFKCFSFDSEVVSILRTTVYIFCCFHDALQMVPTDP